MKTLLKILGVVAAILLVLFLFLRAKLNPEALGEFVLTKVNAQAGMALEADRFEIGIFRGLVLEGAVLTTESAAGSMSAELGSLVLEYQLLPLLSGELVIDRIVVESPRIDVITREVADSSVSADKGPGRSKPAVPEDRSEAGEQAGEDGFSPVLSIAELRIIDAHFTVRDEASADPDLTITGLDLELTDFLFDTTATDPIAALQANGGIRLEQITAGDLQLEGGRGDLVLADGVATVTGLGIKSPNGEFEVDPLTADVADEAMAFELSATGNVDLDSMLAVEGGGSFGHPSVVVELSGGGGGPDRLTGDGTLVVPDGTLPSIKMLGLIEKLLGGPSISGQPYTGAEIRFHLGGGVLSIDPFELGLPELRLGFGGTAYIDGELDMAAVARLPRSTVDVKILDPFIDSMTDDEGWTTVPFTITGPASSPQVDLDLSAAKESAVDMGKNAIEDAVTGLVDKQLGKLRKKKKDGN